MPIAGAILEIDGLDALALEMTGPSTGVNFSARELARTTEELSEPNSSDAKTGLVELTRTKPPEGKPSLPNNSCNSAARRSPGASRRAYVARRTPAELAASSVTVTS